MRLDELLPFLAPALDEVSNGVTLADARDGAYALVFVNRAFERLTGDSPAEALGKNCRFLQGAGTDPRAVEVIRTAISRGEPCHVCLRNYRKDGTAFFNELKLLPIRAQDGGVEYYVGIQNDVTAQLLARALRQHDSSLSPASADWQVEYLGFPLSLDPPFSRRWGSEIGVLVADHRGQICYANRSAGQFVGVASRALMATNVFDHFDADWLSEALRSEAPNEQEWLVARLCGAAPREVRAELSTYRVSADLSSRPFYVILLRDLPEAD